MSESKTIKKARQEIRDTIPSNEEMANSVAFWLCEQDHAICECNRTGAVQCEVYRRKGAAIAYKVRKYYLLPLIGMVFLAAMELQSFAGHRMEYWIDALHLEDDVSDLTLDLELGA